MNIEPLEDRVAVERLDAADKSRGGIVLPDTAKEKPTHGRIVAVGPGRLLDSGERSALPVGVGDEVLFGRYAGSDFELDGKTFTMLRELDILAKVEK